MRAVAETVPIRTDPALPFAEALDPFVFAGWERLEALAGRALDALAPGAAADLRHMLRAWLAACGGKVLAHELSLYRLDRQSSLERALSASGDVGHYRTFVGHLVGGDWDAVAEAYPEWSRLHALFTDQWVANTVALLSHWVEDRERLEAVFEPAAGFGRIECIRALSDDRHRGGRTILRLDLEHGRSLVYKPRPTAIEAWFGRLLASLGEDGTDGLGLRSPRTLDRGDRGWCELVAPAPCESAEQVPRFYRRCGSLLAVLHALGATDCHLENVIATGEHPVLVDAETVLQGVPWFVPETADRATVVETGFLPLSPGRGEPDTSGLDGGRLPRFVDDVLTWDGVGTDRTSLRRRTVPAPRADNCVTLRGEPRDPSDHVSSLVRGFEATYDWLCHAGPRLIESQLWAEARQHRIRYLARSTATYWQLALESLEPALMANGADRRRRLERMRDAIEGLGHGMDRFGPVVDAEVRALRDLDIPVFTACAKGRMLYGASCVVPWFFRESALTRAERRILRLDARDRQAQSRTIEASLGRKMHGRV